MAHHTRRLRLLRNSRQAPARDCLCVACHEKQEQRPWEAWPFQRPFPVWRKTQGEGAGRPQDYAKRNRRAARQKAQSELGPAKLGARILARSRLSLI